MPLFVCVYVCLSALNPCKCGSVVCLWVWVSDRVWDEAARRNIFLSVCSPSTIKCHLLCSPPPAEDCQLLTQIPKVRCLRNGRREGECAGTRGTMGRGENDLMEKILDWKGDVFCVAFFKGITHRKTSEGEDGKKCFTWQQIVTENVCPKILEWKKQIKWKTETDQKDMNSCCFSHFM